MLSKPQSGDGSVFISAGGIEKVKQSERPRKKEKQYLRKKKFVLQKVKKNEMISTTVGTLWR